jgi:Transposase DDE domain group 1
MRMLVDPLVAVETEIPRMSAPEGPPCAVSPRETSSEARTNPEVALYNLANFLRTLALPAEVEHWSLTTLREKLVKIGAPIVRHGRYVVFQLAEVAVPRALFAEILRRIERLRPRPPPFSA